MNILNFVLIVMSLMLAAILAVVIAGITFYNGLIYKKNQVDNAFSTIDVILHKRWDLIPNLVAVAQNYMKFEERVLTEITRLRNKAISEKVPPNARVELENKISSALGHFMTVIETFPELKTNENFLLLQGSLNEVEEQISAARRFYNTAVTEYNSALEMFPTNLIATYLNYKPKQHFQAKTESRQNVNVRSLLN